MKKHVLILENQSRQFEIVSKKLSDCGYIVFPKNDEVDSFWSWVRVFLNGRYSKSRRDHMVKNYLLPYLERKRIDLLVVDHNLIGLGVPHARDGIWLAGVLREQVPGLSSAPILFMSRSSRFDQEVSDALFSLSNYRWMRKGYTNDRVLSDRFFERSVLPSVEELLTNPSSQVNDSKVEYEHFSCFVSFSSSDEEFVDKLCLALKERGVDYWRDVERLTPGDSLVEKITGEIGRRDRFILCYSKIAASERRYFQEEVKVAFHKKIQLSESGECFKIIPLDLDGSMSDSTDWIAARLSDSLAIPFRNWARDEEVFQEGVNRLLRGIRKPTDSPSAETDGGL